MTLLWLTMSGAKEETRLSHPVPTCKELVTTAEWNIFLFPVTTPMISKTFLFVWTELKPLGNHLGMEPEGEEESQKDISKSSHYLRRHCPPHTSCWGKASNIPISAVTFELPCLLKWITTHFTLVYYLLLYPELPSGSHEIFSSKKLIRSRNFSSKLFGLTNRCFPSSDGWEPPSPQAARVTERSVSSHTLWVDTMPITTAPEHLPRWSSPLSRSSQDLFWCTFSLLLLSYSHCYCHSWKPEAKTRSPLPEPGVAQTKAGALQ